MKFPFSVRYRLAMLVVAVSLLPLPVRPQQRQQQQRPAPKPAPAATAAAPTTTAPAASEKSPSVTFDTLLSADAYGIYAEMRAVGRHADSPEFTQLVAPFSIEGNGAPAELLMLYEFIKSHADALMTSRLMFATMPARPGLPEILLAVEMASVEEARKFVPELKRFVAANIAPPASLAAPAAATTTTTSARVETSGTTRRRSRGRARAQASAENRAEEARAKQPAAPQFQIRRAGSLIAMSDANFTFKDLHGANQALLVNDPGFQAARTRFNADTLFVYFNTVRMTSSTKQRMEAYEKERLRQEELAEAEARKRGAQANSDMIDDDTVGVLGGGNTNMSTDGNGNFSVTLNGNANTSNANSATSPEAEATPEPTPTPKSEKELEEERRREQSRQFAQTLGSFVFGGQSESNDSWPESIGIGASLEGDALVVRGLFVDLTGDQPPRPIPFLPVLLSGPAIAAEATTVLPADMDIFLSVSLDLPQMYDYLTSLMKIADLVPTQEEGKGKFGEQLSAFEKANNFRIREELLAALGNEIAIGMPGNQFFGGRAARRTTDDSSSPPPQSGPIVVIALNDRESLQKLLPRVLNAIGFAGASEQNIVEKHGEVEVLTFSNGTLAFIDRFLVGAPDAATMRRVTDAYNSGETLANNERFRDSTSWQSKQGIGQVYVSNTMLKGVFGEVIKSADDIDEPAVRAYLLGLDPNPGAITHLATRESDGLMHELRLPKNLLSLFSASTLVNVKLATMRVNEAMAEWKLRTIHTAQENYKKSKGGYGTLEELTAGEFLNGDHLPPETEGYEVKISVSGDKFEATATPTGYPKLGRRSFYIDQTGVLRGGDTGGKPASESLPIIE